MKRYHELTIWPAPIGTKTKMKARNYTCGTVTHSCLRWTIGILILIAAISILPVIIIAYISTDDAIANQPFYVNSGQQLTGQLTFNHNTRQITWDLITFNVTLPLNTIHVHGPIAVNEQTGPFVLALCGAPSTLACALGGVIEQTNPDGLSLASYINGIRNRPFAYYVNVTAFPDVTLLIPLGIGGGRP